MRNDIYLFKLQHYKKNGDDLDLDLLIILY